MKMNKEEYIFNFGAEVDGATVSLMSIDALGRFYIRDKRIRIDEKEGRLVFHALRDYAEIIDPGDRDFDTSCSCK